jgi:uncharacterized protein YndB with AHSA1/START domain
MKEASFGTPILRNTPPSGESHPSSTVEVTEPHRLATGYSMEGPTTKLSYITVTGFNEKGDRTSLHQIPQLPTALGRVASRALEWLAIRASALRT